MENLRWSWCTQREPASKVKTKENPSSPLHSHTYPIMKQLFGYGVPLEWGGTLLFPDIRGKQEQAKTPACELRAGDRTLSAATPKTKDNFLKVQIRNKRSEVGRRDVRRTFGCTHGRVALLASHQGVTAAVSEGHWGMAVRNQSPELVPSDRAESFALAYPRQIRFFFTCPDQSLWSLRDRRISLPLSHGRQSWWSHKIQCSH